MAYKYKTVYGLLKNPKRWTTLAYARDATGRAVGSHDPTAVCWCLSGAIEAVCTYSDAADVKLLQVINKSFPRTRLITRFNDRKGRTHKQILKVVKDARI